MIEELDCVVLSRDFAAHGLRAGDIGAVVHRYAHGAAFEVEFVTMDGQTVALLTLSVGDIRPASAAEIPHARPLSAA